MAHPSDYSQWGLDLLTQAYKSVLDDITQDTDYDPSVKIFLITRLSGRLTHLARYQTQPQLTESENK